MTTLILGSVLLFLAVSFFAAGLLQHNANRREIAYQRSARRLDDRRIEGLR